jgi:hypothetical protein
MVHPPLRLQQGFSPYVPSAGGAYININAKAPFMPNK